MAIYRRKVETIAAERVQSAAFGEATVGCWPPEVTPYEGKKPNGAIGFVGTGNGIEDVWDGDFVIRDPNGPCRVCRGDAFQATYEPVLETV